MTNELTRERIDRLTTLRDTINNSLESYDSIYLTGDDDAGLLLELIDAEIERMEAQNDD
jgi:hypothetical protein